jgi:hypothetical protein
VELSIRDRDAVFSDGRCELRLAGLARPVHAMTRWLDGNHREQLMYHPLGRQLVALLERQRWIVHLERPLAETTATRPLRTRQLSYFAHLTRMHPDRAFREVEASRVLIIGTGGIGSYVAFHLLSSGLRQLVLNDPDAVEPSNLNRQILFSKRDIGQPKVEALRRALRARFADCVINVLPHHLDLEELQRAIAPVDLVLLCGEHPGLLDHPEVVGDRAIITAGYFGSEVFAGPAVSPRHGTPRWEEVISAERRNLRSALERASQPLPNHWNSSGSTINAMGGALLGEAAVRLLAPSLGDLLLRMTRRFIEMRDLSVRNENIERAA